MKKLALFFAMLFICVYGARATVTISHTGYGCQLPVTVTFTATLDTNVGPLTYQWGNGTGWEPSWVSPVPSPSRTYTAPGTYVVVVAVYDQFGNSATGTDTLIITDSCTQYLTLSGHLYDDTNGNCAYDAGEPGFAGLEVACGGMSGTYLSGSGNTDSDGFYNITVPYDSGYYLAFSTGPYLEMDCGLTTNTFVSNPSTDSVHDFALSVLPLATISGYVYSDQNGNCAYEATEYGYYGRVVWCTSSAGSIYQMVSTGPDGYYSMQVPVNPQPYNVFLDYATDYLPICPAPALVSHVFTPTDTLGQYDFAITMLPMTQVSGHVYTDANTSCAYDTGEAAFAGRPVYVQSSGGAINAMVYTDASGYYYAMLPIDSMYTLTIDPGTTLSVICPASGAATIGLTATPVVQDFALACIPSADPWDLAAGGFSGNYNVLQNRWLTTNLQNTQGTCMDNGAVVKLSLNAALILQSTGYGWLPDSIVGQDIYWHVDAGTVIASLGETLTVLADSNLTTPGDTLCSTLTILHNGPGDANAANDTATICGVVTGSFDPNEKAVSPQGQGAQGYLPAQPQTLSYLINFQNTGTDTAYNVVVRDTLSAAVDWSTLKVLNASHPINMTQGAGGAVAFNFPNILLPDSNVNEAASHGFVVYSVKMQDSLAPGTPIANTAFIYFDNNEAVVTNTTLNTIELQAPTGVRGPRAAAARVYPNPASTFVTVVAEGAGEATLSDVAGRALRTASGQGNLRMDVRDLPEGLYWLKLKDARGTAVQKVRVAH